MSIVFLLAIFVLAAIAVDPKPASPITFTRIPSHRHLPTPFETPYPNSKSPVVFVDNVEADTCEVCINAAVIEINLLANQILNGVIVADCESLCEGALSNISQYAVDACDIACIGVGLDEFINMLVNTDIDPIYYCQLIYLCAIDDCQGDCIDIPMYITQPPKIPQGSVVQQYFTIWVKKNWTGTGMMRFIINDPVQGQMENDVLLDGGVGPVGKVTYGIQIPTAEVQLTPNVTIQSQIQICNGECGSQHPNSRIFCTGSTNFMIIGEAGAEEDN